MVFPGWARARQSGAIPRCSDRHGSDHSVHSPGLNRLLQAHLDQMGSIAVFQASGEFACSLLCICPFTKQFRSSPSVHLTVHLLDIATAASDATVQADGGSSAGGGDSITWARGEIPGGTMKSRILLTLLIVAMSATSSLADASGCGNWTIKGTYAFTVRGKSSSRRVNPAH